MKQFGYSQRTRQTYVNSVSELTYGCKAILCDIRLLHHRVCFMLKYSCGLRIGETLPLGVNQIDLSRRTQHMRSGKP